MAVFPAIFVSYNTFNYYSSFETQDHILTFVNITTLWRSKQKLEIESKYSLLVHFLLLYFQIFNQNNVNTELDDTGNNDQTFQKVCLLWLRLTRGCRPPQPGGRRPVASLESSAHTGFHFFSSNLDSYTSGTLQLVRTVMFYPADSNRPTHKLAGVVDDRGRHGARSLRIPDLV